MVESEDFGVFDCQPLLSWYGITILCLKVIIAQVADEPLAEEPHGYDLVLLLERIEDGSPLVAYDGLVDDLLLIIHCIEHEHLLVLIFDCHLFDLLLGVDMHLSVIGDLNNGPALATDDLHIGNPIEQHRQPPAGSP